MDAKPSVMDPDPEQTPIYLRRMPLWYQHKSTTSCKGSPDVVTVRTQQMLYVAPRYHGESPNLGAGRWQIRRVELVNGERHDYICSVHSDLELARLHVDWTVAYALKQFSGTFGEWLRLRDAGHCD